jgi:dimethylhistidine N-methyltransferase
MTASAANGSAVWRVHNLAPARESFRQDVLDGLTASPKRIPSKYFYDETGSRLFERICALEAYYPTRTEIGILTAHRPRLAAMVPPGAALIEYGSGSAVKNRILLSSLRGPRYYVPIDISRRHLLDNARAMAQTFPALRVIAVCADFGDDLDLDGVVPPAPRVGFFPGSTIGNLTPDDAGRFLARVATTLGRDGVFIVGVDLRKDRAILEAAYDDAEGVTARFNLNLLDRINRELQGSFDLSSFAHRASYKADAGRIEMHLESLRDQTVGVAGRDVVFRRGETIHTENSYKYDVDDFQTLATAAGFRVLDVLVDPRRWFSVHCLAVDGSA